MLCLFDMKRKNEHTMKLVFAWERMWSSEFRCWLARHSLSLAELLGTSCILKLAGALNSLSENIWPNSIRCTWSEVNSVIIYEKSYTFMCTPIRMLLKLYKVHTKVHTIGPFIHSSAKTNSPHLIYLKYTKKIYQQMYQIYVSKYMLIYLWYIQDIRDMQDKYKIPSGCRRGQSPGPGRLPLSNFYSSCIQWISCIYIGYIWIYVWYVFLYGKFVFALECRML